MGWTRRRSRSSNRTWGTRLPSSWLPAAPRAPSDPTPWSWARTATSAQVKDLSGNLTTTEWRFTVTGGILRGTVLRADGTPASGAPLSLDHVLEPPADGAGGFVFTGLRPGLHTVEATDSDTGLVTALSLTLGDGEDRTLAEPLRLPAFGRIAGTVRRADGTPAPGVTVSLLFRPGSVSTGADGRFDLGAQPLGNYTLQAAVADGDRGQSSVTLTTLGVTVNGDINLNGVGLVRVTLRDGTGALVGGASVTVTSSSPFAALLSGVTASDGGAAVFPSVLAGTITARATHPTSGLHGETTGLLTPGGTLDLPTTLQPTGRIAGTVLRREGGVAAGVTVTLDPAAQPDHDRGSGRPLRVRGRAPRHLVSHRERRGHRATSDRPAACWPRPGPPPTGT